MALKDNLEVVKKELSSDEKLLEQAFQLEKFYKKHKIKIYAILIVLTIGVAGYKINNYLQTQKLLKANEALIALQSNPNNKEALNTLKQNNQKLYSLYLYSKAANEANEKKLSEISVNDELLKDVIAYHKAVIKSKAVDSIYYRNLSLVEKAYLLIKEGKKTEAKNILAQVSKNSALAPVARLLEHYTIK
jgi:hypothetical protein